MKQISPAQAILIVIDSWQRQNLDPLRVNHLKQLYLLGVETKSDSEQFQALTKDPALADYTIIIDPKVINDDASRRYFETHFAMQSLVEQLKTIKLSVLKQHYDSIRHLFDNLAGDTDETGVVIRNYEQELHVRELSGKNNDNLIMGISQDEQNEIDCTFSGTITDESNEMDQEYADMIKRTQENRLNLSDEDRIKVELLIKCAYLAIYLDNKMVENTIKGIYSGQRLPEAKMHLAGYYHKTKRGRVDKYPNDDDFQVSSQALGIIKGYSPLPRDDIAFTEFPFEYFKPSERSTFDPKSEWIKMMMSYLVHPFSNSISGTMLSQLRLLLKLKQEGEFHLHKTEQIEKYLSLMICSMLSISGGHTLYEFASPIWLSDIKHTFKFLKDFDKTSFSSLFYVDNHVALDRALKETIEYNHRNMLKEDMHLELKSRSQLSR